MIDSSLTSLAGTFVETGIEANAAFSNMKLQKLVTLAQSLHMYRYGQALFQDDVQAWDNGPVVKPLYGMYKDFKKDSITQARYLGPRSLTDRQLETATDVWRHFGECSVADLWKLTHSVGPWRNHYISQVPDIVIPLNELGDAWPDYKSAVRRARGLPNLSSAAEQAWNSPAGQEPAEGPSLGKADPDEFAKYSATYVPSRVRRGA